MNFHICMYLFKNYIFLVWNILVICIIVSCIRFILDNFKLLFCPKIPTAFYFVQWIFTSNNFLLNFASKLENFRQCLDDNFKSVYRRQVRKEKNSERRKNKPCIFLTRRHQLICLFERKKINLIVFRMETASRWYTRINTNATLSSFRLIVYLCGFVVLFTFCSENLASLLDSSVFSWSNLTATKDTLKGTIIFFLMLSCID